jgi:hypothetical protein
MMKMALYFKTAVGHYAARSLSLLLQEVKNVGIVLINE